MIRRTFFLVAVVACCFGISRPCARAADGPITVEKTDDGAVVKVNGQLFTKYVARSNTKPILYPVIGPTGKAMTRNYPMDREAGLKGDPTEKSDHPHHRSFWLTHGEVNHSDFWLESAGSPKLGYELHRGFDKLAGGERGVIVARIDWVDKQQNKVLEEVRTFTFSADNDSRTIDVDSVLSATEGPVTFGDTKEGSFGLRVPGTMKVDAKKGGKIVNSEGQANADAWGKRAEWVDYQGPVEGDALGIAILNHPSSFRHPTWWHVRTYGLFAANPFGVKDFERSGDGSHTLAKGESLKLRHRVVFHKGDEKQADIAGRFQAYAKEKK